MQDKLQILLKQIEWEESYFFYFEGATLNRIIEKDHKNLYSFEIELQSNLPLDVYLHFLEKLQDGFPDILNTRAIFRVKVMEQAYIQSYFHYFIEQMLTEHPLFSLFLDLPLRLEQTALNVLVSNRAEQMQLEGVCSTLEKKFMDVGYAVTLNVEIDTEKEAEIKIKMEAEKMEISSIHSVSKEEKKVVKSEIKKENLVSNVVLGKTISADASLIRSVLGEMDSVIVEGYVFGVDYFESNKSQFKIITLKITDYSDSMYCKVFIRDNDEYKRLSKALSKGKWFKIKGNVKFDKYANEIVLNASDINPLDKKIDVLEDTEAVKRVELHAHTMMSQMDGVTKLDLGKHTC